MTRWIISAFSIAVISAGSSYGTEGAPALPNWPIAHICAKESAPGQCAAFEGEALRTVSATWAFVADAAKRTCLVQLASPVDQSWRLLAECIDTEAFKVRDRTAVKTAKTPGEPVPATKPSPEAAPPATPLPTTEPP